MHNLCPKLPSLRDGGPIFLGEPAVSPHRLTGSASYKSGGTPSQILARLHTPVTWTCDLCQKTFKKTSKYNFNKQNTSQSQTTINKRTKHLTQHTTIHHHNTRNKTHIKIGNTKIPHYSTIHAHTGTQTGKEVLFLSTLSLNPC